MGGGGVNTCGNLIANFSTFHLGPALAFNLNRRGSATRAREKAEFLLKSGYIAANQPIMCAFGEIDCRVHVLREAEKNYAGDFRPVVDKVIANYLEFLKFLAVCNPVYIWGPIPSQKDGSPINPSFPYYGTELQRNLATQYFNERLQDISTTYNFNYVSIFRSLINEDYSTKSEYIADGCHLSQSAWRFAVQEFAKYNIRINFNQNEKISKRIQGLLAILRYYDARICRI